MDDVKRRPDLSTEKAVQSVMPDQFMDDRPNVCRFDYISGDNLYRKTRPGILARIVKRLFPK